jgi:hypothetical protein
MALRTKSKPFSHFIFQNFPSQKLKRHPVANMYIYVCLGSEKENLKQEDTFLNLTDSSPLYVCTVRA